MSPITDSGDLNKLNGVVLSINTGILVGILSVFILIFAYLRARVYEKLQNNIHYKKGLALAFCVSIVTYLKFENLLDTVSLGLTLVILFTLFITIK